MMINALRQIHKTPTELITFSDDMDGLRKVPDNIPNSAVLKKTLENLLLLFQILLKNFKVLLSTITQC